MVEAPKDEKVGDEGSKSIYAGLSQAQIKKLKAKMKAEKEAAAKVGGEAETMAAEEAKKAPEKKPAKGKKPGGGAAIAEKIRAQKE